MDISRTQSTLLKCFIGFLSLTALIAIVSVFTGEFGDIQLKTLATTFAISAASICSMACAAFIGKRGIKALGISGISLSSLATLLTIAGVWTEANSEGYWKATVTFIALAAGLSYALLLLLPTLKKNHTWTQYIAAGSIGLVTLMVILAIWGEIDLEGYYRLLVAVTIVVVLFTLIVPILMKLDKRSDKTARLILKKNHDGTYQDEEGNQYRLEKLTLH